MVLKCALLPSDSFRDRSFKPKGLDVGTHTRNLKTTQNCECDIFQLQVSQIVLVVPRCQDS